MSEMCWTLLAENTGRKNGHLGIIAQLCRAVSSQLRHVLTIVKNILSSNISSTCPHNTMNFGPLAADIDWRVWGTPVNFNGFRALASLLQRRRSTEANQTAQCLAVSWVVDYLYIFGSCCPVMEFCQVQNSLCVLQVLHSPILAALLHGTRAVGASQSLRR